MKWSWNKIIRSTPLALLLIASIVMIFQLFAPVLAAGPPQKIPTQLAMMGRRDASDLILDSYEVKEFEGDDLVKKLVHDRFEEQADWKKELYTLGVRPKENIVLVNNGSPQYDPYTLKVKLISSEGQEIRPDLKVNQFEAPNVIGDYRIEVEQKFGSYLVNNYIGDLMVTEDENILNDISLARYYIILGEENQYNSADRNDVDVNDNYISTIMEMDQNAVIGLWSFISSADKAEYNDMVFLHCFIQFSGIGLDDNSWSTFEEWLDKYEGEAVDYVKKVKAKFN